MGSEDALATRAVRAEGGGQEVVDAAIVPVNANGFVETQRTTVSAWACKAAILHSDTLWSGIPLAVRGNFL